MYLVAKEEYDSLVRRSEGRTQGVEGIAGNVTDSNVNNIEVTDGGTIVIRSADGEARAPPLLAEEICEGKKGGGSGGEEKKKKKRTEEDKKKTTKKKDGDDDDDGNDDFRRRLRTAAILNFGTSSSLAAKSKNLQNANQPPNALSSARREEANRATSALATASRESRAQLASSMRDEPTPMDVDEEEDENLVEMESVAPVAKRQRQGPVSGIAPLPKKPGKLGGKGPNFQKLAVMNQMRKNGKVPPPRKQVQQPQQKKKSSATMNDLVKLRLKQLRGDKTSPPPPPYSKRGALTPRERARAQREEEENRADRAILHSMRDMYKEEMKASASRKEGRRVVPAKKKMDVTPLLKRRRDELLDDLLQRVVRPRTDKGPGVKRTSTARGIVKKKRRAFPPERGRLQMSRKRKLDDDDDFLAAAVKRARYGDADMIGVKRKLAALSGAPASKQRSRGRGTKRRMVDDDDVEAYGEPKRARYGDAEMIGVKRKATTSAKGAAASKQRSRGRGTKRKRVVESSDSDEEERKSGRYGPSPVLLGVKRKKFGQLRRDDHKVARLDDIEEMPEEEEEEAFPDILSDGDDGMYSDEGESSPVFEYLE